MTLASTLEDIDPTRVRRNPYNPRRFFNDEALDLLRSSIQEVGVLVPIIVYRDPERAGGFVLMDGERRWTCATDLALATIPANVIDAPSHLSNILRMFNIHSVREDWPLISVALSLREVMAVSGEDREIELSRLTGLSRGTVRRARRLLSLPPEELERIGAEAHLDREKQVHREDLYLEIEAAESLLRNSLPEIAKGYSRPLVIRQFARKREEGSLRNVTDFRDVGKLIRSEDDDLVSHEMVVRAAKDLIDDVNLNPSDVLRGVVAAGYEQQSIARRVELLIDNLRDIRQTRLGRHLRAVLEALRHEIDRLLGASQ